MIHLHNTITIPSIVHYLPRYSPNPRPYSNSFGSLGFRVCCLESSSEGCAAGWCIGAHISTGVTAPIVCGCPEECGRVADCGAAPLLPSPSCPSTPFAFRSRSNIRFRSVSASATLEYMFGLPPRGKLCCGYACEGAGEISSGSPRSEGARMEPEGW